MTTGDIETLSDLLGQLSTRDLLAYRAKYLAQLPSVDITSADMVVNDISNFLLGTASTKERLHHMALAYCWLMPRGILSEWRTYLLEGKADWSFHCPTLFERISVALRVPGHTHHEKWYVKDGTFYACILTEDEENRLLRHNVVTIALWSGLPFLAVRTEGESIRHRFEVALEAALVKKVLLLIDDIYDDLDKAFVAGRRLFDLISRQLRPGQQYSDFFRGAPAGICLLPAYEIVLRDALRIVMMMRKDWYDRTFVSVQAKQPYFGNQSLSQGTMSSKSRSIVARYQQTDRLLKPRYYEAFYKGLCRGTAILRLLRKQDSSVAMSRR